MSSIETIDKLIERLNECEEGKHAEVVKAMNIPAQEFERFATWSQECYTRNCIERTDAYEVILLCWEPGNVTAIHSHGGERCWVYQIDGSLNEIRFDQDEQGELVETHQMTLEPGKLTYMEDSMGYHQILNESGSRAMTLHIYASPIDVCKAYDEEDGVFKEVYPKYTTIKGKVNEDKKVG